MDDKRLQPSKKNAQIPGWPLIASTSDVAASVGKRSNSRKGAIAEMKVSFHLSFDVGLKCWHLEAHDIQEGRWYSVLQAAWPIQLKKLHNLGISSDECGRLAAMEAARSVSFWTEAVDIEAESLAKACFILQPTMASAPIHLRYLRAVRRRRVAQSRRNNGQLGK